MKKKEINRSDDIKVAAISGVISSPADSLSKEGGAIRGIGEEFAANSVIGTGSIRFLSLLARDEAVSHPNFRFPMIPGLAMALLVLAGTSVGELKIFPQGNFRGKDRNKPEVCGAGTKKKEVIEPWNRNDWGMVKKHFI